MNRKNRILQRMDRELAVIAEGGYDLRSGESYLQASNVHYMIRTWFSETAIDERVLELMDAHREPLERMYDYYVDSGCLIDAVDGINFCHKYAANIYLEHMNSLMNEKIQEEYNDFLETLKKKPPYDIPALIAETTIKMDVLSLFRYDSCFCIRELSVLKTVPDLLDRIYEKCKGKKITATDMNALGKIVIESIVLILDEYKEHCEVEDEALEA